MRIFAPFAVALAVAQSIVLADQPPGIDYLGAGYDLIFGNPDGSEAMSGVTDPGFRVHLISFNWEDENNTCSGLKNNWTCPREASVLPDKSCIQQSSSSAITSTKEFQQVLQQDCSVSASLSGSYGAFNAEASFSGSKAMASMQNKITKDQVTTFQSKAVCVEYSANLKLGFEENQLQPLPEFESAVGALPQDYKSCFVPDAVGGPCPKRDTSGFGDLPPTTTSSRRLQDGDTSANNCACDTSVARYFRFIQLFGTHYTTYVEMGGKIIHRLEIKNSDVETLTDKKVDVAFGASIKASFGGAVASVGASVEVNGARSDGAKAFNSVMQVAQKEININVGGSPSEVWQTWADSTTDTPMPIRYRLSSLIDLIQVVDPLKVAPFEAAVQDYIAAYSKTLSFDMSPNSKVQKVEIKYTITTGDFDWVQFQVMIGPKGSMLPVDVRMYNTTGSFTVDIPDRFHYSFGAFVGQVPVTLQYASGRFYPPTVKKALMEADHGDGHKTTPIPHHIVDQMEAEKGQRGDGHKATPIPHRIVDRMEAENGQHGDGHKATPIPHRIVDRMEAEKGQHGDGHKATPIPHRIVDRMEAEKGQHGDGHKATPIPHRIVDHMEAEKTSLRMAHKAAMEAELDTEAKVAMSMLGGFGLTTPPTLTLVAVQASDNAEIPLGDQFAGAQLKLGEDWAVNPING